MHPPPPIDRLVGGLEVALVRSHPVAAKLPRITRLPGAIRYVPAQYLRYYTRLDEPFEAYLKKFSSKSRSTLQRKVRKFAQASGGTIAWREFTATEEMAEFHGLARQVSSKTYQERLLDAGLPAGSEFLRMMQEMASAGNARGYILYLSAKPAAYIFCPITEGALLYQYVGYDPDYHNLSPGTVLQYLVFEKLMSQQDGIALFDFTEGEGQHKEFFSTDGVLCADLYYFRPTVRNRLLLSLHACTDSFSGKAASLLNRLGLKARIKRLLRGVA